MLPLLLAFGLAGYGAGMVVLSLVSATVRGHDVRRLFGDPRIVPHALRAMAPTLPAAAVVLPGVRHTECGGSRAFRASPAA